MALKLPVYSEPMTAEELQFLVEKDEKETRTFYRVLRFFMAACFVIPFAVAWSWAVTGELNPFSYVKYFLGVGLLLSITGLAAWYAFSQTLKKVKDDIRRKVKTVEKVRITRKQHVRMNDTYYFYLDSPTKLSIEVAETDFYLLNDGDELNIEYSPKAKFYFGYF